MFNVIPIYGIYIYIETDTHLYFTYTPRKRTPRRKFNLLFAQITNRGCLRIIPLDSLSPLVIRNTHVHPLYGR